MHGVNKLLTSLLLLGALSAQPALAADPVIGNFTYRESVDPLDDSDRSFIVTMSLENSSALIWKCGLEGIDIFVFHEDEEYERGEEYSVIYRFDKNETREMDSWYRGSNTSSLFMDSGYVNEFTLEALESEQLVIRPDKPGIGLNVLTFEMNGLKGALAKMSCADF